LWLIVGPAAIIAALVFYLFRLADEGVNVLPGALIGAGVGAALIFFLYGNDRPDPNTLANARWRWGLAAIPIAVVVSGRSSMELIFLGFLGGFLTLFVVIVEINMVRDRR
jgi:hypothetical protein